MIEHPSVARIRLDAKCEEGTQIVGLAGSLADDANIEAKEYLMHILEGSPRRMLLDLSETEYISSSGIGLLVSILRRCRQSGVQMGICALRPEILELFKLTRLNQVFSIYEDRAAGLKGLGK
jgi:anti-sigma B factor antagonist